MDSTKTLARWVLAGAILVGIVVSVYLVDVYVVVSAGADLTGGLCDLGASLNCAGAAASRYSSFMGVPVALWGLGFYVAVALAWVLALRESGSEGAANAGAGFIAVLFLGACVYSLFLGAVSVLVIGSLCPACFALYVVNAIGAFAALRWSGSGPLGVVRAQLSDWRSSGLGYGLPVAAALGLVVGAGVVALERGDRSPGRLRPVAVDDAGLALLRAVDVPSVGPEDARVLLVEFSDFECPYCSRFAGAVHDVQARFADQMRVEFRHFPLDFHANAVGAAAAAVCAGAQGRFWQMHDLMFDNQQSLDRAGLLELARAADLDPDALEACLDAGEAESIVQRDIEAGQALGVTGTPTFFVNGREYVGAMGAEALTEIVEDALASEPD